VKRWLGCLLVVLGCTDPLALGDGQLTCNDGECPDGFACRHAPDGQKRCYRGGSSSNGAGGSGGAMPATCPSCSITALAAGLRHTCALTDKGEVWCWGDNTYGQVEPGGGSPRPQPRRVLQGATGVSVGDKHSCAIVDQKVQCWGDNAFGQVTGAIGLGPALKIAAGGYHTCAKIGRTPPSIWCWGKNLLGDGAAAAEVKPTWDGDEVALVASGARHSCAIGFPSEQIWCWGDNTDGQLGRATSSCSNNCPPEKVTRDGGLFKLAAVALGESHSCGYSGKDLYCWGKNDKMQLGTSSNDMATSTPSALDHECTETATGQQMAGFSGGLTLGGDHGCIACDTKTNQHVAISWGDNTSGQLARMGNPTGAPPGTFGGLTQLPFPAILAAGGQHTCAVTNTMDKNEIWCAGANDAGQLGSGTTSPTSGGMLQKVKPFE
jgi:alpha-tubulin suppressor-like RCC1 family protein